MSTASAPEDNLMSWGSDVWLVRLRFRTRVLQLLSLTTELYRNATSAVRRTSRSFEVCTVELEKAGVN